MKLNKEQKNAAMNSLLLNPSFMKVVAAQGYTPLQLRELLTKLEKKL